jgi:hypothetical protein
MQILIQNLYIITESGGPLYNKDYEDRQVNPSLLSGFISAISHFAQSIGEGEIKSMIIANRKWFYITQKNLICICIAAEDDDEEVLKKHFLKPLLSHFIENYKDYLVTEKPIDTNVFQGFDEVVDSQKGIYRAQSAEKASILSVTQALTINGAIEMYGIENLALILRHVANHRLAIVGDEFIVKKVGALIQSLTPIHITSEINEYTDLYISSTYPANPSVQISTFSLSSSGWTNQIFKKAEFEKNLLKEVMKKREKGLSDMDIILLFRTNYIALMEKVTEYMNAVGKYKDSGTLSHELQQIVKDRNGMEFLHGYIKKNVGLDIDELIEKQRR